MFRTYLNIICFLVGLLIAPALVHATTYNCWVKPYYVDDGSAFDAACRAASQGTVFWTAVKSSDGVTDQVVKYKKYRDASKTYSFYNSTQPTPPPPPPPWEPNGVKDPDEDGIDCGGDTGVECKDKCPQNSSWDPKVELCVPYKTNPIPEESWPDDAGDYPSVIPDTSRVPVSSIPAGADVDVPDTMFPDQTNPNAPVSKDPTTTTFYPNGDFITRSPNGTPIAAKITGTPTSTDNGDGTTSTSTPVTTFDTTTGQEQTTTGTTTTDNGSGEVLSDTTSTSGTSGNTSPTVQSGSGSSDSLSGDEFSWGIAQLGSILSSILDSINGFTEETPTDNFQTSLDSAYSEFGDSETSISDVELQYSQTGFSTLPTVSQIPDLAEQAIIGNSSSNFQGIELPYPFEGQLITSDDANKLKDILGWILSVSSILYIFNIVIMANSRET